MKPNWIDGGMFVLARCWRVAVGLEWSTRYPSFLATHIYRYVALVRSHDRSTSVAPVLGSNHHPPEVCAHHAYVGSLRSSDMSHT